MGELVIRNEVERVERFYALQAGQYWAALNDISDEAIVVGDTLLITSLRYVEDKLHTVILRAHPRHYGTSVSITTKSDDVVSNRSKTMTEHRFLARDFLNQFEYQPNHKTIREAELSKVQQDISRLQLALSSVVSDPAKLRQLAIEQIQESDKANAVKNGIEQVGALMLPSEVEKVASLAVGTIQNALVSGISETRIEQIRDAAMQEARISTVISQTISRHTSEISKALEKMTPFYQELAAATLATTEESLGHVKKIQEGVGSLELYIGKNVTVIEICTGESAPSHIPLQICQRKLMVDEEIAMWINLDEYFDYSNMADFRKALQSHPELVDQIFPSQRSVVCMATTRRHIDYKDRWENAVRNEQNQVVFLLVRDGENIHQVYSPVESHLGSCRLFPSADEQESHFRGYDGSMIKFEDVSYSDRLKNHELMALHYKRFLILICGLDHRLKLFGYFYDASTPYSFLTMEFQQAYFQFLHDDDGSGLLEATETRPSVDAYIQKMNSTLQSGSRVLCNWYEVLSKVTAPGAVKEDRSYSGVYFAARPLQDYDTLIAFRQAQHLMVNASVKKNSNGKVFNCKVNLSLHENYSRDNTQLGYLCLDSVRPEDLEWYIRRRKFHTNHLFYIRFFKMALNFVHQEREEEEPHRHFLNQALIEGNIGTVESRPEMIEQCVIAWRASNRGIALSEAMKTKKGQEELLNQLYQLGGVGVEKLPLIEDFITSKGWQLIRVSVNASGKLVAYAAPAPYQCDNRLEAHAWVHRLTVSVARDSVKELKRSWVKMTEFMAAENTLSENVELVRNWSAKKTGFKNYEEKQRLFDMCSAGVANIQRFNNMAEPETYMRLLAEWLTAFEQENSSTTYATYPVMMAPVAMMRVQGEVSLIYVGTRNPEDWFLSNAPSEALREVFVESYSDLFVEKEAKREKLLSRNTGPLSLAFYGNKDGELTDEIFTGDHFQSWSPGSFNQLPHMLNDQWMCHCAHFNRNAQLYLTPGLINDDGEPDIDECLNYPMPEGLKPVYVFEFERDHFGKMVEDSEGKAVRINHWFDISETEREVEDLLGPIPDTGLTVRKYRMDNLQQVSLYVEKGGVSSRRATELGEWHQPPEGVTRLVKRSR